MKVWDELFGNSHNDTEKYRACSGGNVALYVPLQSEEHSSRIGERSCPDDDTTPFARAGFFSRMSFWWLNPMIKKGKEKTLQENDIPQLRFEERAESCYITFMDQMSRMKEKESSKSTASALASVLSAIYFIHRKAILISGLFALIKVLALATTPLFLMAFIEVAEGKEVFKHEGYALCGLLFLAKCIESLSERQRNFRTRLIGLQVRSMLSSAICRKQLRLSNASNRYYSPGEIVNYVAVDAYRIGEFPFWFHQIWTTSLQLILALLIIYNCVGLATIAAIVVIVLTVVANLPMAKLQQKYHTMLLLAQDRMLKALTESLTNMKVLKLYAWETHFMNTVLELRKHQAVWLSAVQWQKGYYMTLFWSSPVLVSVATFGTCYFLGVSLSYSKVFTFIATLRLVQEPIRILPDVGGIVIQAKVSLSRIVDFLEAPELEHKHIKHEGTGQLERSICLRSIEASWSTNAHKPALRNINLSARRGEKIAICGEVGSGKSTLVALILGEVPYVNGTVEVNGRIAYVSQSAWIQTGTIQENILFGSAMDMERYRQVLERCSLLKDLEMLPFGDLTEIGERGINLSGGQKQRVQLARALYQDSDIYLLDDPSSALDAHTATDIFNEYIMVALYDKTVLLVTHKVDFLPSFDSILLLSEGQVMKAGTYNQLMTSSKEFQNLVNAHSSATSSRHEESHDSIQRAKGKEVKMDKDVSEDNQQRSIGEQLFKQEERETGDIGLRPYLQYLSHGKGLLYLSISTIFYFMYFIGQVAQNYWLAANLENAGVGESELIAVYSTIGCSLIIFLLLRTVYMVLLGLEASESILDKLMISLFRAPMLFYDSTPLGRIISRFSSDLSTVDLDLPLKLTFPVLTLNAYLNFGIFAMFTWQISFIIVVLIYVTILLQRYFYASVKELMRINGTTKSFVASHLTESIAGSMTIRAFGEEDRFFSKILELIDANARPFFHQFSETEWLILRLELLCSAVLCCSTLAMVLLHHGTSSSGFVGMALSYGFLLNIYLVYTVQSESQLANSIVSMERLEQYMHIPSEALNVIHDHRPGINWPSNGRVEIYDLKVRYRPNTPLVLQGITCVFEGGHKIGIVGRTGSGKTTLISALFRLVEPAEGRIIVDNLDISTIGLHDLRSHLGIIPQEPMLFNGSIRYNLDPLSEHLDEEIWEVLAKCQLREAIKDKEEGLSSLVMQDGSNWSMGQRQLFCLGRVLLRKSRILVLDEATASIDNATDAVLQKTIRTEFADCTVMTVAHRIPTVIDCSMVLSISDGKVMEYDEPMKLMNNEGSLFGELVKEYRSGNANGNTY